MEIDNLDELTIDTERDINYLLGILDSKDNDIDDLKKLCYALGLSFIITLGILIYVIF